MDLQRNEMGDCGLDSYGIGQEAVAGCCEHGTEPPNYIKIKVIY
jgi:hypothetical protein